MEVTQKFKQYLLSQKQPASGLTVKNYLADVGKFTQWFEKYFHKPFTPTEITPEIIMLYKQHAGVSPRSLERHLSSLRKFFYFLKISSSLATNPFDGLSTPSPSHQDRWHLKDFKSYLYVYNASDLTIKNYIIDIKQFLNWVTTVSQRQNHWIKAEASVFDNITTEAIEEYKSRLLEHMQLAPTSVNRKLSSIRKFVTWAQQEHHLKLEPIIQSVEDPQPSSPPAIPVTEAVFPTVTQAEIVLPQLQQAVSEPMVKQKDPKPYSSFPPARLLQKSLRAGSNLLDLIVVLPLVKLFDQGEYLSWLLHGKKVFSTSLPLIGSGTSTLASAVAAQAKRSIQAASNTKLHRFMTKNIRKDFYAPYAVSVAHLPLHKKLLHHARYTRPKWYRMYHSYPVVHYFHFAILLVFMTAFGYAAYNGFIETPQRDSRALAAATPLRVLSFQGRLTDTSDNAITKQTEIRFTMYNDQAASGSARLWEEVRTVKPDSDGVFSVLLGHDQKTTSNAALCSGGAPSAKPATGPCGIPQSIFRDNNEVFLGITIENDAELTPRQQIATVAYATNAEVLQGLAPITQSGAGTKNVILALDSAGNLSIGGTATPKFEATGGQFTLSGKTLVLQTASGTNSNIVIAPNGSGVIDLQKILQNSTNSIGLGGAEGAVVVADQFAISATLSAQPAFLINQNDTGPLISASVSGTAKFTVNNDGSGIFAGDIDINGGDLKTNQSSFNLLNATATTVNFAGAATALNLGASSGTTTISNSLQVNKFATVSGSLAIGYTTAPGGPGFGVFAGNVGIGTADPGAKLDVSGTVRSSGLITANGGITVASGQNTTLAGITGTNAILYATESTGVVAAATTNTQNLCFMSGTSSPTWASCSSQGSNWDVVLGAIAPKLASQLDLLVGGTATSSATFHVYAQANDSITAGTASMSGDLILDGAKSIQTTKNQTLTLGGSTTGLISFVNNLTVASSLTLAMNNSSITNANQLTISDPGIGEGVVWNSTSANWEIEVTDLNRGNVDGNLNFYGVAGSGANNSVAFWRPTMWVFDSGSVASASAASGGHLNFTTSLTGNITFNPSGNVGINTITPNFKLEVIDSQTATAAAQIYNTSSGTDADGLVIKLGNSSTSAVDNANHFISFETAGIGIVGAVRGNGSTGIEYKTNGIADFAEYIKKDINETIAYGSLICLDEKGRASACNGKTASLIGVASENPAFSGGKDLGNESIAVGLVGQVATRVSSANGVIQPGDLLTSSSIPGVAVKATTYGVIVGKALESYNNSDPSAVGKIYIVVQPGWHDPDVFITDAGELNIEKTDNTYAVKQNGRLVSRIGAYAKIAVAVLKAGKIEAEDITAKTFNATGQLVANSASFATDNVSIAGQSLENYIAAIVTNILNTTYNIQNTNFASPLASIDRVKTNLISPIAEDQSIAIGFRDSKFEIRNSNDGSGETLASIDNQGNASFSGTLRAKKIIADEIDLSDEALAKLEVLEASDSATYVTNITNVYQSSASGQTDEFAQAPPLISDAGGLTGYGDISSMSAYLTYVRSLNADFATFNQGLVALEASSFTDLSVLNQLSVGGNLTLSDNSINVLGANLEIQPLRQGDVTFMGGLIAIDIEGNFDVKGNAYFARDVSVDGTLRARLISPVPDEDLVIQLGSPDSLASVLRQPEFVINNASGSGVFRVNQKGDVTASGSGSFKDLLANVFRVNRSAQADTSLTETVASASAGTATIVAGQLERTIINPSVTQESLIYLTPVGDTQGVTPYLARQTAELKPGEDKSLPAGRQGSFTISIPQQRERDIKVNWWIVN